MLYPLVFATILKERLWGGRNLESLYGKALPPAVPVGESWEISDRPGDASVITNGPLAGKDLRWLMEHHGAEVMGRAAALDGRFPLLVKILDAREILSVQVHPPARVAPQLGGEPKTEMWYVTQAAPGARLSAGLKAGVTRTEFERRLRDGKVAGCIHEVPVRAGDAMFLPSGRIHALGANMVIFEIQQNSDTTYRVFDWNRVGADGRPRELHVDQALACIDFADYEPGLVTAEWRSADGQAARQLVNDPLFAVAEHRVSPPRRWPWPAGDRPVVFGVVSGSLRIQHAGSDQNFRLAPGQFALLPASARQVELTAAVETTFLAAEPGSAAAG